MKGKKDRTVTDSKNEDVKKGQLTCLVDSVLPLGRQQEQREQEGQDYATESSKS